VVFDGPRDENSSRAVSAVRKDFSGPVRNDLSLLDGALDGWSSHKGRLRVGSAGLASSSSRVRSAKQIGNMVDAKSGGRSAVLAGVGVRRCIEERADVRP